MVGRNGKYNSGWPWSFSGFSYGWLILIQQLFFFSLPFLLLACTPKILVQLLGNTVANKVFVVFCFLFLVFNGDQIEVSLFPFFFYYSIIGERKFETRECPLNYKVFFIKLV